MTPSPSGRGQGIGKALGASRTALASTGVFSLVINLLMLTGPLFMLQVYDRALTSGSVPTLVALVALVGILYGLYGFLEFVRARNDAGGTVSRRKPAQPGVRHRQSACAQG